MRGEAKVACRENGSIARHIRRALPLPTRCETPIGVLLGRQSRLGWLESFRGD